MCYFFREEAYYAVYLMLLWQLWPIKQARIECDIMCVPLFADINVFNPYNSDIIVFSLEWCPGITPEVL